MMEQTPPVLITDEYLEQIAKLRESEPQWGNSGWLYAEAVKQLTAQFKTRDVLDYGCGTGTLAKHLPFPIKQYDPGVPGREARPEPADIVVCGDVMEHIEPDCVGAVIEDIQALTKVVTYWVIATRPASMHLPDGRNCHLVVKDSEWWLAQLLSHGHRLIAPAARGRKNEAIFQTAPL